jgi:uncharacterized protein (TIGR02246 family)
MNTPSKHSSFVVFIFCILLTLSCNKEKKNEMNLEELNSFGKRYGQAWSSQDPERVAEFFGANGALTVNGGEPAIGRDAIAEIAKGFMEAFPDMVVLMDSLVIKSGKTQFHWTLTGTNTGEGGAGNKVEISGFEEWRINEDGLVQESFGSFDSEEYDRQLIGTN